MAGVLHYGAVDLDPEHLVVWVLLAGEPDALPEWLFPTAAQLRDPGGHGLPADLPALVAVVRGALARHGWPAADAVRVGFDSAERVARAGGFAYFR